MTRTQQCAAYLCDDHFRVWVNGLVDDGVWPIERTDTLGECDECEGVAVWRVSHG